MPTINDLKECAIILLCAPAVILFLMLCDAGISMDDVAWAIGYWS